ncbi:MAG: 30S ribosome-binding factor RbfA [Alphaproteobacteria bacterium]|nr:MAG: 30S ribosome-binding factor RbfA [Alphaproteobacteria bacterium]
MSQSQAPSPRMLKVGEEVRHALADIFMRGEVHALDMDGVSITVSEVRMSPDLKIATAYIATLGSNKLDTLLPLLNKHYSRAIRHLLSQRLHLKFLPQIRFRADHSFDEAKKIHDLLHQAAIQPIEDDTTS